MIQGTVPLITLWTIALGSLFCLGLHLTSPWRRTPVGVQLAAFLGVMAVWYLELLVASYAGYPMWLQAVEAVTFIGIAVVVVWLAVLMVRYRWWLPWRQRRKPNREAAA